MYKFGTGGVIEILEPLHCDVLRLGTQLECHGGAIMNYGHAVTIDHCHKVMNQKSHRVFFSIDNHPLSFDDFELTRYFHYNVDDR